MQSPLATNDFTILQSQLTETVSALNDAMEDLLPELEGCKEDKIIEAMRYSAFSEGKRLRPFLVVNSAKLFGVNFASAIQVAVAIELIHTFSLVHDDLPAMDDDDFRRGQPSCHKKFDEATAILAGDALFALAFEIASDDSTHPDPRVRINLVKAISQAVGYDGMVGGQMLDLISETEKLTFSEVVRLQRMKTGALFELSCEAGAILGRASQQSHQSLKSYANNIGLAFQIIDDLLDSEGTRTETGKLDVDEKPHRETLIHHIGPEKAREHAQVLANQAVEYLKPFDERANVLRDLAHYIVDRKE